MTGKNLKSDLMKAKSLKVTFLTLLCIVVSCDEPETTVTDIVHADGSVTRRIEMRNIGEKKFEIHKIQVPFDSTWIVRDSLELGGEKGEDSIWVKRAEKNFAGVEELNKMYAADSGSNKATHRYCEFVRKFRWFNTTYTFGEVIQKQFKHSFPVSEVLNKEELDYFYSPEDAVDKLEKGPDSTKYKALKDTIDRKAGTQFFKSAIADWVSEFTDMTKGRTGSDLSYESLHAREDELLKIVQESQQHFDSLWNSGIITRQFIGESNVEKFRKEADSSLNIVSNRLFVNFNNYSVRIVMPGKLIGTNGRLDSLKNLCWPVKSDYFLTQDYKMWAESKETNLWAWIVTGVFLLFVAAGLIFRSIKRG
jgi:hypothetical protein